MQHSTIVDGKTRRSGPQRWHILLAVAAAAILMLLVVLNGYPLVYDDTTAYMRRSAGGLVAFLGPGFGSQWLDAERLGWLQAGLEASAGPVPAEAAVDTRPPAWISGRSVYYGLAVYVAYLAGGLWGSAALQALAVGILLYIAWFRVLGLRSVPLFLAAVGLLTFGSSLGYFVGLVMPDIFAALTILSFALLIAGWDRLSLVERVLTGLIAAFSVLAHDTHLLIGGGLFALFLITAFWRARRSNKGRRASLWVGGVMAACLAIGLVGGLAYSQAAVKVTGEPPLRLPHITAHMASLPQSAGFIRQRCQTETWAVCAHADKLPMSWITFMFYEPQIFDQAPRAYRRALSEQQLQIAGAMLMERPLDTIGLMISEAAKQVVTFSYYDLGQREMLVKDVPAGVKERMRSSLLVQRPGTVDVLSTVQQWGVVVALLALGGLLHRYRAAAAGGWAELRLLSLFLLAGIFGNAVICGVLAYPYDRFQARVIWLVPLAALLAAGLAWQERRRSAAGGVLADQPLAQAGGR